MELKKDTLTALNTLKILGLSRREVERELGLTEKSIDQALSRGGNTSLLSRLKTLIAAKTNDSGQTVVELNKAIENLHTRLTRAENVISVLKDNDVFLLSRTEGKNPASVNADLEEAIAKVTRANLNRGGE